MRVAFDSGRSSDSRIIVETVSVSVACTCQHRRLLRCLPHPVSQIPHGQRFVEVTKAFEGNVAGKHVKPHDAGLPTGVFVDGLVVQDDVARRG